MLLGAPASLAAALGGLLATCCLVSLERAFLGLSGAVEDKYSCPHGWTRYGGKKCLKYVSELQDYERAQATCRSKNQGTLVTVHSHEEQNFVYSYIHSIAASSTPIWLGAKQIDFESILWLDKTENSYTNWAPSEPSHPDEICIAINPRNGLWHDVMCTEANVPACERAPTTQWPFFVAFCSEGWFQYNDEKCVRIISSQALNFYESQELCRSKYNSKLLSIKTDKESEFVHNLIKFRDVKLPVWLGAVQNDFSSFNWIDKSDVTFTNWAEGEPNDPDHACISMVASGGKWSDNDCKEQKLILCQKVVPEEGACETGWLQFRQDKCYRFVHIRLAFDDAESLCSNLYGGHLPSIHSQEEQFMIAQFLASVNVKNGSEIWLGGRQMDFHNFNWGDGSPFNYSYWEQGEPSFPAEKCIEMSWRNGRWNDINCRLKRAVLCERQVSSRHHLKPILYQPTTCLEANCTTAGSPGSGSGSVAGASASAGAAGAPAASAPVASSPAAFGGNSSDSPPAAAAAPAQADHQLQAPALGGAAQNATLAGANGTASASASANPNAAEQAHASAATIDDKPIRLIASIMNREAQPAEPPATPNGSAARPPPQGLTSKSASSSPASASAGTGAAADEPAEQQARDERNATSSIHYSLASEQQQQQPPPQEQPQQAPGVARATVAAADSQQQQQPPSSAQTAPDSWESASPWASVSLMDKLKPATGAPAATNATPIVAGPATPPAEWPNTTALSATLANQAEPHAQQQQQPATSAAVAAAAAEALEAPAQPSALQQAAAGAPATTQEFAQVTNSASNSRERINQPGPEADLDAERESGRAIKSQVKEATS